MKRFKARYRYSVILLKQLVKTDFKLRYQGSFLGYLWSLLRPLFIFLILYLVFVKFLKVGTAVPHYPVYLLLGIVLWNFFVEISAGGVGAIVGKGDLLRKLNFPKYVIIIAIACSALINLSLNAVVIAVFMYAGKVDISWQALWMIPLIIELLIASLAAAFFLSAAYVRYRDVSYIWEVLIQAAFYATPILYPLSRIPTWAAKIVILNPIAQILQDSRYVLVTHKTETISTIYPDKIWIRVIPIAFTLIALVIAATYFRARSQSFAEEY